MLFLNTRGKGHCQLSCALLISSPANKNQENGRNRLGAYARRWPEHCREVDDDGWGCKTFEIDKGRFCFRLTTPYSEEHWKAARKFAMEHNVVGGWKGLKYMSKSKLQLYQFMRKHRSKVFKLMKE